MQGSAILAVLESDALTVEGPILLKFLSAVGAAAGDPLKIEAAFVVLEAETLGALPALETSIAQQISAAIAAKLQAEIAKVSAAAAPKP